ncbi:MAG: DNA-processing protein DprA [Pelistega sp.]|nr:DNA-processing protein DprA [Pelistega sp.]
MKFPEPNLSSSPGPELFAWLRLTLEPGVGSVTAKQLLAAFGLPEHIFAASYSQLMPVVGQKLALQLSTDCTPEIAALIERTFEWLAKPEHYILTLADAAYPASLLETHDPPVLLYVDGQLDALAQAHKLAMVGARHATVMGESNARAFAKYLAQKGWCIVSGLALGIDAAAHEGALDSQCIGSTIAVMGTGINRLYPAQHKQLALRIKAQGALISELPLDTSAKAFHFPQRNRLVAGLSRGVLVVEAAKQSGSLITARMAADLGKEVFAIPGSIHSPLSHGCHALIRQGAKLVETGHDILEELGYARPQQAPATPSTEVPGLSAEQQRLLDLMAFEAVSVAQLAQRLGLDNASLTAQMVSFELQGIVMRLPDGRYQRLAPQV